jgi:Holliday junction resolvase-like predicted endonuclease
MGSRKGKTHEKEAQDELVADGWQVFKPQKVARYGTQDIFNLFDMVAVKDDRLRFVQVKTNSTGGFLHQLKAWAEQHPVPNVTWELWVRLDARKGETWRKHVLPLTFI